MIVQFSCNCDITHTNVINQCMQGTLLQQVEVANDSSHSGTQLVITGPGQDKQKNISHLQLQPSLSPFIENGIERAWDPWNSPFTEHLWLAHLVMLSGKPNRFGCRIPLNTNWNLQLLESLLQDYPDKGIVEWLRFGFPISRDTLPKVLPATSNHKSAIDNSKEVNEYLSKEIKKGATMGPFTYLPFTENVGISPLATRPKKLSNMKRIIMDLSTPGGHSVNDGINKHYYCGKEIKLQYPTVDTLAKRIFDIGKSCRIFKKDLSHAFRLLPLCPGSYSYICMKWSDLYYVDKSMPMGLVSAAFCCQSVTSAIVHIHKNMNFWLCNYLDDFGSGEHETVVWKSYNVLENLLRDLGATEALEKSVPPSTRMEFLGNTLDTQKQTIEVSEERRNELLQLLLKFIQLEVVSKKELQSLIGKLNFVTNCIKAGRVFLKRLIACMTTMPEHGKHKLDEECKKDIRWWIDFLPSFKGESIIWLLDLAAVDLNIATDASLDAAGGIWLEGKEYFHTRFNPIITSKTTNIMQREMLAVLWALSLWAQHLTNKVIRISTDNKGTLWAINRGSTKDAYMLKCLREIIRICAEYSILLKAEYIESKSNTLPDCLSRWYIDMNARRRFKRMINRTEWKCRTVHDKYKNF